MLPVISDTALNALNDAATQIAAELLDRTGERYAMEDISDVLARWLEASIEDLASDAVFHCVCGDRALAFNRSGFELFLQKAPSQSQVTAQADAVQEEKDQTSIGVERVA